MGKPRLIDRAIDHHRAGRLDEAAELYGRILRDQPTDVDALHLLGLIAYQRGEDGRAVDLIRRAIAINCTQEQPHIHLGMALLRQGQLDAAAASFQQALRLNPTSAPAHNNLGSVRQLQQRTEEALDCFRRALAIDPTYAQAHYNLGLAQRAADPGDAAESFRRAIAANPSYADALGALAEVLVTLGQAGDAIPHFEKALALAPNKATWHCELGDARQTQRDLAGAITAYQQALALDTALLQAWWGQGCAHSALGDFAAAAASFRRAVEIAPDYGEAYHNLGQALFELGQVDPALDALQKAATLVPHPAEQLGAIATIIPGSPRADNRAIREARQSWAALAAQAGPVNESFSRRSASIDGRLRVGYVCSFFRDRNWMKPVWGLINNHDRDRFEIHLVSDDPEEAIRHGYRKQPQDRFHDIAGLSNADAARVIEGQNIDLLIDLNGYSRLARLPLLALRPAPVVVAWFNTFAPTGMSCYDYLIGDEHVIPVQDEAFYAERIVRVPTSYLTYEVTYPVPDIGPAPCLARGAVTFGCLAPQYKITAEVIEAWSRILRACPASRLVLKNRVLQSPDNCRFVHDLFARFDIAGERVELSGPAEHFDFLGKYNEVDVALDTFPYNGGTTTMEALWQGAPVLTYYGDRWVSRISASLLRNAGLGEFVAPDVDGYIDRAIALANAPDTAAKLDALRQGMRDRLRRAPVCDTRSFARDMEREYEHMWKGYLDHLVRG